MHIYVLLKSHGQWSNGSSEGMVRKLCDLIDLHDELVYAHGKPVFINSNYFLSVTHSAGVMVIAIAAQDVGIDVEMTRPMSPEVIERVKLNDEDPLTDWCSREAAIKLYNDKSLLFNPVPPETVFKKVPVCDGYTCLMATKSPPDELKITVMNENDL